MDVSMTQLYSPFGTFFKVHVPEFPNTTKPDVLFLIDISASMVGTPIHSVETALKNVLPKLSHRNLGLILFNDCVRECFGFVGSRPIQEDYLFPIQTYGGTCFASPFNYLRNWKLKNDLILIFLTDGDTTVSDVNLAKSYLEEIVRDKKIKFQIHSICIGNAEYGSQMLNMLSTYSPFSTVQFLDKYNVVQSLDVILPLILESSILRVYRNENECFSVLSNAYFRGPVEKIETHDEKTLNVTIRRVSYQQLDNEDAYEFLNFALRDSAKYLCETKDTDLLTKFEQYIYLREAFNPLRETVTHLRKLMFKEVDHFEEKLSFLYDPAKFLTQKVESVEDDKLVRFFYSSKPTFTKIKTEVLPELSCFVSHETAAEAHNNGDVLCLCLSQETAAFNPCLAEVKVLNCFITFESFKSAVLHARNNVLFPNLFGFKVTLFLPLFINQLQWDELGYYYLMAAASIMTTGKLTRVSEKATETLPVFTWIDLVLQEPKTEWGQRLIPLVEDVVKQAWKDPYKNWSPFYLRVARLIIAKENMTLHFRYAVEEFFKEEKEQFKSYEYECDFNYLKSVWLDTRVGKLFRYAGIEFDMIKEKCFSFLLKKVLT
jgi:hypothetical protein